ncbi:hypothetical protein FQA39_LY06632 [Lamprigera yunnana]|nr:hypothetical protein FQA39_LY06632 [Lamprigera yunnana]
MSFKNLIDFNSPQGLVSSPDSQHLNMNNRQDNVDNVEYFDTIYNPDECFTKTVDLSAKESLGILKLEELNLNLYDEDLTEVNATELLESNTLPLSISIFNNELDNSFLPPLNSCFFANDIAMQISESYSSKDTENEKFEDFLFSEANNLGSNINIHTSLDCITPPKLVDLEEEEEENTATPETLFKKNYNSEVSGVPHHEENWLCANEIKENLHAVFNNSHKQGTNDSNSNTKRDANMLLSSLSAIINDENRDSKQNEKGLQLLFSLAEILCFNTGERLNNKSDNLDEECSEILDLRINKNIEQPLDLSKNTPRTESKIPNQLFTVPQPPKLINVRQWQGTLESSACSNSKIKPKKIEDIGKTISKGPLKAILPMNNMSKRIGFNEKPSNENVTPAKLLLSPAMSRNIRRGTPTNELQLTPIAQSTPGNLPLLNQSKSNIQKSKSDCSITPVTKRNSFASSDPIKSTFSASIPNIYNKLTNSEENCSVRTVKSIHRRYSVTEWKTSDAKITSRHSYSSVGKNKKNSSNKFKETISTISNSPSKRAIASAGSRNILKEKNNCIVKSIKSLNFLGKKDSKENISKH